jgi:hypothetical protein
MACYSWMEINVLNSGHVGLFCYHFLNGSIIYSNDD